MAGLDISRPDDVEDGSPPPRERDERTRRIGPEPDPLPFVPLPQRTTHGGYWGPKMRAKLIAEALADRRW